MVPARALRANFGLRLVHFGRGSDSSVGRRRVPGVARGCQARALCRGLLLGRVQRPGTAGGILWRVPGGAKFSSYAVLYYSISI